MNKEKTKLKHSSSTKSIKMPLKNLFLDVTISKENRGFNTARDNASRKNRPKLNSFTKYPALST